MADQLSALRYVTDRLSSANKSHFTREVPVLIDHLSRCSEILCGRIDGGQAAIAKVHKLKTQLSSLLQDKTIEARWASVVLLKTVIEAVVKFPEGWDFLQTSGPYLHGLLAILGKPDPVPTKTMATVTLTRVFLLTRGRPTLTREITTPHLSSFVAACLSMVTTKHQESKTVDTASPYLAIVLQCFIRLLPNHPAIFRPFNTQIRSLISPLLAPTPSQIKVGGLRELLSSNDQATRLAQRLHSLLPTCAPKNGAAEEWKKYVNEILNHINQTADTAFRAVLSHGIHGIKDEEQFAQHAHGYVKDELLLDPWEGVPAGCERITGLIELLSAYLDTEGQISYQIPVKPIYDMADRMLSIIRPRGTKFDADTNYNRLVSREERETLFMFLTKVQTAVLDLLSKLLDRMSISSYGFAGDLFDQIAWLAQKSVLTTETRIAVFKVARKIIELVGPSFSAETSISLKILIKLACKDLDFDNLEASDSRNRASKTGATQGVHYNADSFTSQPKAERRRVKLTELQLQACRLLRSAMFNISAPVMSQVRLEIDRVAVLLQDQELQLASILNPSQSQHTMNMVPFLSNVKGSHNLFTEALIQRWLGSSLLHKTTQDEDSPSSQEQSDDVQDIAPLTDFSFKPVDDDDGLQTSPHVPVMVRAPETVPGINTPSGDSEEHVAKRPRLDLDSVATSSRTSPPAMDVPKVAAIGTVMVTETRDVEMDHPADSDSDDSFEIPEIVVGLDDSEDEAEEE